MVKTVKFWPTGCEQKWHVPLPVPVFRQKSLALLFPFCLPTANMVVGMMGHTGPYGERQYARNERRRKHRHSLGRWALAKNRAATLIWNFMGDRNHLLIKPLSFWVFARAAKTIPTNTILNIFIFRFWHHNPTNMGEQKWSFLPHVLLPIYYRSEPRWGQPWLLISKTKNCKNTCRIICQRLLLLPYPYVKLKGT